MRLMITGAGGFLGSRLASFYEKKDEVWALSHKELDFTDEKKALEAAEAFCPDVLIHAGAVSDVGACSADPELSMRVNVEGTQYLARACAKVGARMVFCSSDQVYFGSVMQAKEQRRMADVAGGNGTEDGLPEPHRETEILSPIPVYGQHKLLAEQLCLAEQPDSVILRLTWMYGKLTEAEYEKGRRNLATMLEDALAAKAFGTSGGLVAKAGAETDGASSGAEKTARQAHTPLAFSVTDYRGVTDVREVVRNMEAAWRLPAGVYNFGSPNDVSIYETVRRALRLFGQESPAQIGGEALLEKREGGNFRNLLMSPDKLAANHIRFSETAEGLARWLRENI